MCYTRMWPGPPALSRYSKMRRQLHDRSPQNPTSMFMISWKFVVLLSVGRVLRCCAQVWATVSWLTQMWRPMNGSMLSEASFCTAETLHRELLPYHLLYVLLIIDTHNLYPSACHPTLPILALHCQIPQAYISAPLLPALCTLTFPPRQNLLTHPPLSLHIEPYTDSVVMSLSPHFGLLHLLPTHLLSLPWPVALMLALSSSLLRMTQTLVSTTLLCEQLPCV